MSKEERERLLKDVGAETVAIPPSEGLAMKADLCLPWRELRELRR